MSSLELRHQLPFQVENCLTRDNMTLLPAFITYMLTNKDLHLMLSDILPLFNGGVHLFPLVACGTTWWVYRACYITL